MSDDFHSEIESLAKEARKDSLRSRFDKAPPPPSSRRVSTMLSIALVLVLLELGIFIALKATSPTMHAVPRTEVETRFDGRTDCKAIAYATYRAIVTHMRENGRPPASLNDLVGEHLEHMPVDPATGEPLQYQREGSGFSLDCPK